MKFLQRIILFFVFVSLPICGNASDEGKVIHKGSKKIVSRG